MDHGPLYVDQRYHYVRPSLRSNHNENMLLLLEGHFWYPEVITFHLDPPCNALNVTEVPRTSHKQGSLNFLLPFASPATHHTPLPFVPPLLSLSFPTFFVP